MDKLDKGNIHKSNWINMEVNINEAYLNFSRNMASITIIFDGIFNEYAHMQYFLFIIDSFWLQVILLRLRVISNICAHDNAQSKRKCKIVEIEEEETNFR